jgi:alkylated DNA repair protein alkB homolog 1
MDEFKKCLHRFRRQPSNPERTDDLAEIYDFSNLDGCQNNSLSGGIARVTLRSDVSECYRGPLYTLKDFPGFLYAPNAMSQTAQLQLAYQAVTSYCLAPHTTNIELVPPKEHETSLGTRMWDLWKREHFLGTNDGAERCCQCKKHYLSFHKLAWATMGYHYNWTARAYPDCMTSDIPSDLEKLSQRFARASLIYSRPELTPDDEAALSFRPTATIVNYYHSKSIMGPHRDDSEHAISKPIVSFSMGRPAVFLLGGETRDDRVVPILIRPGDVMIMGGATRLNYHCMARLLPHHVAAMSNEQMRAVDAQMDHIGEIEGMPLPCDTELAALEHYLKEHRININLRQVYDD